MENLTCGKDIFRETTRVTQATSSSYFTKVRYLVTWHNLGTKAFKVKKERTLTHIKYQLSTCTYICKAKNITLTLSLPRSN